MAHLNWIRACWQCDGCGKDFVVDIDSAWKPPSTWDTTKMAEDAVRHGHVVPQKGGNLIVHSSSVQHDLVLCGECTNLADGIGDEGHQPTKAQILGAVGA
jgi:hypothetical protein